MNPSIIHQIFKNNFPLPYYFSDHALSRISQRIIPRDTILLKFLLLSFKRLHINALDNVQKSSFTNCVDILPVLKRRGFSLWAFHVRNGWSDFIL